MNANAAIARLALDAELPSPPALMAPCSNGVMMYVDGWDVPLQIHSVSNGWLVTTARVETTAGFAVWSVGPDGVNDNTLNDDIIYDAQPAFFCDKKEKDQHP